MSENDPESIVDTPLYTKDEEYIGIIQDIDGKNGNSIIKGKLELRNFSVLGNMVVDSANINNQAILDMAQDDLFKKLLCCLKLEIHNDKLLTSLRTASSTEYSLDKSIILLF
jgi:hypothetical protein